ncbi:MAG: hypothetical protein ABFS39_13210 [Pseudomonadota bacterium]
MTWIRILSIIFGATLITVACAGTAKIDGPTTKTTALTKDLVAENTVTQNKPVTHTSKRQTEPANGLPVRPDLSGLWTLNREMSDNPREKIKEATQQARSASRGQGHSRGGMGRGGQRSGGMGGRPSSARMVGRGRGRPGGESMSQGLRALLNGPETMELTHEEPMLLIVTDDGKRQRVFTDMRGASVSAMGGMDQNVTIAGWEQDVLVIETTTSLHPRLIQEFKLDADTHRLLVRTIVQPLWLAEKIIINRLYEAAEVQMHTNKNAALLPGE